MKNGQWLVKGVAWVCSLFILDDGRWKLNDGRWQVDYFHYLLHWERSHTFVPWSSFLLPVCSKHRAIWTCIVLKQWMLRLLWKFKLPDFLLHLPITWAQQYYVYQDSYYFGKLSCFLKNIFNGVVKAKGNVLRSILNKGQWKSYYRSRWFVVLFPNVLS